MKKLKGYWIFNMRSTGQRIWKNPTTPTGSYSRAGLMVWAGLAATVATVWCIKTMPESNVRTAVQTWPKLCDFRHNSASRKIHHFYLNLLFHFIFNALHANINIMRSQPNCKGIIRSFKVL